MIKTLKRKTLLITTLSVGLVLLIIVFSVNILNYRHIIKEADYTLYFLALNDGRFPNNNEIDNQFRKEAKYDTRYFSVALQDDNTTITVDISQIFAVNKTQAINYANQIVNSNKSNGTINNYRYLYYNDYGVDKVLFMDIERSLNAFYSFLFNSILISLLGMSFVIFLAYQFSKVLLKPVEEAFIKQKRFITDASHELKTPITIIKANMEVLKLEELNNKWIDSTNKQADRMSDMVSDLLFLARMDEENKALITQNLNVENVLLEVIEDYEPIISENYNLKINTQDYTQQLNYEMIKRLFNVLLENSIRYTNKNDEIIINLSKNKHNKTNFSISNKAYLSDDNLEKIFNRFERLEKSRNQQLGGSGIGLSIAKSIVDSYNGKITASYINNYFTINILI